MGQTLSRRTLLGRAALLGAGAATTGRRRATARQGGLTGSITVSFSDDKELLAPHVAQAVAGVRGANPGAEISVDYQQGSETDYVTRLLLGINAGEIPDVFHVNGVLIGELAAAGFLTPLDSYVNAWPDWASYLDVAKSSVTFNGNVWAIPYVLDTHFLYYRRDIFERAGLPRDWQPANLAGILEAARTIKANVPDVVPYALYAGQQGGAATAVRGLLPLAAAYGGTLLDEQNRWIIDSCPIRNGLAYYEQAYQIDKVIPEQIVTTPNIGTVVREQMSKGQLAILFEGSWVYGPWHEDDPTGTEQNIGYTLHPTAEAGPSFTVGGLGGVWFIGATTQAPDLAWEFIRTWCNATTVAAICLKDPHPPARNDAAALPDYQANPFMVAAFNSLPQALFNPPDTNYRKIIGVVENATGLVALGDASPADAVDRYAGELTRIIGEGNVIRLPCP